ncbi:MAG: serine/threonine protein kinase, partial [Myxococcaceae bacterium]|nr:serine/threonine protein kinase [Myxococcaceae bacterium]
MDRLGPFQIIRRLGSGGSAEVFLARGPTPSGEAELALKLILPHLADDGGHRAMLLREARMVMPLRHPNIVEIYDVGEVDGRTWLAMEYLSGWPFHTFLKGLRDQSLTLSLSEAAHLVREAALGLHHAHEATDEHGQPLGIVHRDVSPHNLMVSRDGHVKVVDFGLARATHTAATQTGGLKGKLRYMPPEQLRSEPLDRRADVFALGAILWDLALGQPLHPGPTEADIFQQALFLPQPHPDEVAPGLPRAFVDVLQRAVAREADRRFASALALADALVPFIHPDAAAAVARLGECLQPSPAPERRPTREEVIDWDAPPAEPPRVAPSRSQLPHVRRATRPSGSAPPVLPHPQAHDSRPRT